MTHSDLLALRIWSKCIREANRAITVIPLYLCPDISIVGALSQSHNITYISHYDMVCSCTLDIREKRILRISRFGSDTNLETCRHIIPALHQIFENSVL